MNTSKNDIVSIGVVTGIIIPIFCVLGFLIYSSARFGGISEAARYFQSVGIMYKILSVSLMPGVGLFFYWTRNNKNNQARGILLSTMFYGIFVLILYMS